MSGGNLRTHLDRPYAQQPETRAAAARVVRGQENADLLLSMLGLIDEEPATTSVADVVSLLRPTRTDGDSELDLPPCARVWPGGCSGDHDHRCWTWRGWPHTCRCMRCGGAP